MPSINIYVSADLQARMRKLGRDVNWSERAQIAFRSAVLAHEHGANHDADDPLRVQRRQAARIPQP